MVLGDNIFCSNGFSKILKEAVEDAEMNGRATVFEYYVPDPVRLGVVAFDENWKATSIEEKRRTQNPTMQLLAFTSIQQVRTRRRRK